jgi:hypothetical protein
MIEFILLMLGVVVIVADVLFFHVHVSFFRGKTSWLEKKLTEKVRYGDNKSNN